MVTWFFSHIFRRIIPTDELILFRGVGWSHHPVIFPAWLVAAVKSAPHWCRNMPRVESPQRPSEPASHAPVVRTDVWFLKGLGILRSREQKFLNDWAYESASELLCIELAGRLPVISIIWSAFSSFCLPAVIRSLQWFSHRLLYGKPRISGLEPDVADPYVRNAPKSRTLEPSQVKTLKSTRFIKIFPVDITSKFRAFGHALWPSQEPPSELSPADWGVVPTGGFPTETDWSRIARAYCEDSHGQSYFPYAPCYHVHLHLRVFVWASVGKYS